MSFLKNFGMGILKGSAIITSAKLPPVITKLDEIAGVIKEVEVIGQALNLPGGKKLEVAMPLVIQMVLQSTLVADRKIADVVKFNSGVEKIINGVVDVLNSVS